MKKIFLSIFLVIPSVLFAQSSWEAPTSTKQVSTDKKTKESNADAKYLKGAVPEVDGLVVYNINIDLPGMTVNQIYDRIYNALEEMVTDKYQVEGKSNIAIVNKEEHAIGAHFVERMIFQNSLLVLDETKFNYTLLAECQDGKLKIRINRLSYDYSRQDLLLHMTAEETITDKNCLSKNEKKLKRLNAKFRKKTVDRMSEIETNIREAFK